MWAGLRCVPAAVLGGELLVRYCLLEPGGHGECLRRNHWRYRRGRAGCLTRQPDSSERGNYPRLFHRRFPAGERRGWIGATSTEGRGWDGAAVVLRARESRVHGQGWQRVSQGEKAMSGDTLVNTGVMEWPDPDSAYFTVREMQIKLHRWAGEDASRRFGDLMNLVYDPAFLVHAWERVAGNKGARTAGIDRATVVWIET